MAKHKVETYWAIRIGRPGRHDPYLMVEDRIRRIGNRVPRLFTSRAEAAEACKQKRIEQGRDPRAYVVVRIDMKVC